MKWSCLIESAPQTYPLHFEHLLPRLNGVLLLLKKVVFYVIHIEVNW